MKKTIAIIVALILFAVVSLYVGHNSIAKSSSPKTKSLIFKAETQGGFCEGPCSHKQLKIYSNGDWNTEDGDTRKSGKFEAKTINKFQSTMSEIISNLNSYKKRSKFCESFVDGIDTTITMYFDGEKYVVSSCDYDISNFEELFNLIESSVTQ